MNNTMKGKLSGIPDSQSTLTTYFWETLAAISRRMAPP